ncbi:MAG: peptidoglycan editing factor PgeF [Deltaproteobacteria bacterium]|nr:peptidoglycan editing factor PgeF [Deltaproteobacteria bacterium]
MRNNVCGIRQIKQAYILEKAEQYKAVMAFSLRTGGCSGGPYKSLNFSTSSGDSETHIHKNLEILSDQLNISSSSIISCHQEHGDNILIFDHFPKVTMRGDAIIALEPGMYPSVKTADCLPILIIDPITKISAAIHAGWRGTVLRITRKVLITMTTKLGCKLENLLIALGPAVGVCCYEVDQTVIKPLLSSMPWAEKFAVQVKTDSQKLLKKAKIDLASINRHELVESGILPENIYLLNMCTSCHEDKFFSYRRDGEFSGRSIAITGFRSLIEKKSV